MTNSTESKTRYSFHRRGNTLPYALSQFENIIGKGTLYVVCSRDEQMDITARIDSELAEQLLSDAITAAGALVTTADPSRLVLRESNSDAVVEWLLLVADMVSGAQLFYSAAANVPGDTLFDDGLADEADTTAAREVRARRALVQYALTHEG